MRIALTADLHLKQSNPERLRNLEILIGELLSGGIRLLVIAGDLFDASHQGCEDFDRLAERAPQMRLLVLPGNHDPDLRQEMFTSDNIRVFTKPTLRSIDRRLFLFLPYTEGATAGQMIAGFRNSGRLRAHPWILVSHGDFGAPRRGENGQERGYFPLTRRDLARFQPLKVILGHIHLPNSTSEDVVYPGSPYPITAAEYGRRRVLILDTASGSVEQLLLDWPPVYLLAKLLLIPDGREERQIREQLEAAVADQHLPEKLVVQVVLRGYSASRSRAKRLVEALLSERGIGCGGIDLQSLKANEQHSLATLAEAVRQRVERLELRYPEAEELRQAVLEKALRIVYGA